MKKQFIDLRYIEVAFGSVQNRNILIETTELREYASKWKEQNGPFVDCYRSLFRFPLAIKEHFNKTKSVKSYNGVCYSDFLPIDIDSNDLRNALENTRKLILHLNKVFQVDLSTIPLYFSGSKGFHIELPSTLFGFIPSPDLSRIFKQVALSLIPDDVEIDKAIYNRTRLWRIKNTINSKSDLYKIPLSSDELLNLDINQIKELAKKPREGDFWKMNNEINPELKKVYTIMSQTEPNKVSVSENQPKSWKKIHNQILKEGERNTSLTSQAGRLKAKGHSLQEASMILDSINHRKCNPPLPEYELHNIIRSIYSYPDKKSNNLQTVTWKELIGHEEPHIDFLIDDLIPLSCLLVLAGKPKLGKSLLVLLFAVSIGLGEPLWGKEVKKGGVLFISTEDGEVRLKKRIWKMLGDPNQYNPNFHFHIGDCVLTDDGVIDALRDKILELEPKLIVLDPLINLFRKRELNSAEDMNQVLRPLQNLAKETGACVLVIHHARKSAGDDPIDIIQGSITISGVADGLLIMKSHNSRSDNKQATLDVILKDAELANSIVLSLEDNLKWEIQGELEDVVLKGIDDEILEVLEENPQGMAIYELEKITDYSYKQIYTCLKKLEGKSVRSESTGSAHKKVYFYMFPGESEKESERESEKLVITPQNQIRISDHKSSLSQKGIWESDGKRDI